MQVGRDAILDIAFVPFEQSGSPGTPFTSQLYPRLELTAELQQLARIHADEAVVAPRFYELAKRIIEFTEGKTLVCDEPRMVYSFVKKEFKELGFTWKANFISLGSLGEITTTASKVMLATFPRQSLAKAIHIAHTAQILLQQSELSLSKKSRVDSLLPVGITSSLLNSLPATPGVYYFRDAAGEIIYVGKSVHIRKRVRSHFQLELESAKAVQFKSSIASIDFVETGSELLALLIESAEVKRLHPRFNSALRARKYRYAIESQTDALGYLNLSIQKMNGERTQYLPVGTTLGGKGVLKWLVESFGLCQKLCGLYKTKGSCFEFVIKKCQGACIGLEPYESYNIRVLEALSHFSYPYSNFMLLEKGRSEGEKTVVMVKDNHYFGYAFVPDTLKVTYENIHPCLVPQDDDRDVQTIVRNYLAGASEEAVIRF
jgi:DNA polymerase-3 subunit epsilon